MPREAVTSAVSQSWKALEVVAPTNDADLVLAALTQSAEALRFADAALKDQRDFMAKAVAVDGRALHYASARLQADRELLLEASKLNSWAIDCAPKALRTDAGFMAEVVAVNPLARRFFAETPLEAPENDGSRPCVEAPAQRPVHHLLPVAQGRLAGRWRYEDDGDEDFVVEIQQAEGGDGAAYVVRFLFEGQATNAECCCTEREGETLNIYEGSMISEEQIAGQFWCESSGEGNSFQSGAKGPFRLVKEPQETRIRDAETRGEHQKWETRKASRWREALDLLPRDETSVDFWSFSAAIGACSGGSAWPISLALLKRVQQEVPAGELTPVYGGAVSSRAPWHVGLALLAQMETERVPANIIIYSALMSACNRAQQWQVSLQLFQAAERHHFSLDVMAFGAGITAAEKGQQWQSALVLLDQMKEEELLPNLITCNAAIAACGPASPFALELLRALGPRADAVSFESAVTACGRDQAWMTCLSLLEEMEDRGLRRSVIAFGGAIAGQEGHWPHALALLEQMSISKVVTNVIVYSALSSVCSSSSQWQMALQVFEEMQLSLVRGNVVAYSAAISACEKGQQWLKALDFLDEMLRCRVVPNVVTTSSLLASLAGRWELAMLLLMQLPSRACTDVAVYNAAASVCGQGLQWHLVLELLRGMDELQIDMDVITYSTAMGAMEEGLQWQKALQLLEFAVEAQLELDQMCLNAAVNACKKEGQWQQALAVLALQDFSNLEEKTLGALASAFERGNAWQMILQLLKEHPDPGIYALRSAVHGCHQGRCWPGALLLLQSLQKNQHPGSACLALTSFSAHPKAQELMEELTQATLQELCRT
ncbi:unnamed protein product [Durusdinium trenchii]|uniref:DUF4116 domain-containing protein n=1 Tax=Durusdinium trenchii TaxID=1381693 RepID=A0ABP0PR26_9DINO